MGGRNDNRWMEGTWVKGGKEKWAIIEQVGEGERTPFQTFMWHHRGRREYGNGRSGRGREVRGRERGRGNEVKSG